MVIAALHYFWPPMISGTPWLVGPHDLWHPMICGPHDLWPPMIYGTPWFMAPHDLWHPMICGPHDLWPPWFVVPLGHRDHATNHGVPILPLCAINISSGAPCPWITIMGFLCTSECALNSEYPPPPPSPPWKHRILHNMQQEAGTYSIHVGYAPHIALLYI